MIPGRAAFGLVGVLISVQFLWGGCHRSLKHPSSIDGGDAADDVEQGAGGAAGLAGGAGGAGGATGAGGAAGEGAGGTGEGGSMGAGGATAGAGGATVSIDAGIDRGLDAGDAPTGVTHRACSFIGNNEHLTVTKTDAGAQSCLMLVLTAPSQTPKTLGLMLPPTWSVVQAQGWAMDPVRGCALPATNVWNAVAGSGTVVLHDFGRPGATVDVDVQFAFTSGLPPPPIADRISVFGLPIEISGGGC